MKFLPPRGMRDFYPEDMAYRNELFQVWRDTATRYGFQEYDAPVVETHELLARKSGEEIVDQIYSFQDKSGRQLALRPEMTPSLARMIVSRQKMLRFPLKWFTIAQCFRYERTTAGRKREHFQWNLDIVGHEGIEAEVEVISAAIDALKSFGLDCNTFKVHIGSRAVISGLLSFFDIDPRHFDITFLALDKRDKIGDEGVRDMLSEEGLSQSDIKKVFSLLAIRSLEEVESIFSRGKSSRGATAHDSLKDLGKLMSQAEIYGVKDYLAFDISIVRGLEYYTGIVFEAFDVERKLRAIFGGGRYDNLLEFLGGSKIPSVGMGFGDVVMKELLEMRGYSFTLKDSFDYAIGFMTESQRNLAIQVGNFFRREGKGVDIALKAEKPKHFFSRAGGGYYRYAIYIGPDEEVKRILKIKNLNTGDQQEVSVDNVIGQGIETGK
jgi:histidyl-tRNA synthetase